jgi:hypothetical protein
MPFTQQDNLLTLDAGLAHFKAVYMPARNYSKRTREEYEGELTDLLSFLTARNIVYGTNQQDSPFADASVADRRRRRLKSLPR